MQTTHTRTFNFDKQGTPQTIGFQYIVQKDIEVIAQLCKFRYLLKIARTTSPLNLNKLAGAFSYYYSTVNNRARIQQDSTIFNNFQQFSTEAKCSQQFSTTFNNFQPTLLSSLLGTLASLTSKRH